MEFKKIITISFITGFLLYLIIYGSAVIWLKDHPVLVKAFSEISQDNKVKGLLGDNLSRNFNYTFEKKGGARPIYEFSMQISGERGIGTARGRTTSSNLSKIDFKYLNVSANKKKVGLFKNKSRKNSKSEHYND